MIFTEKWFAAQQTHQSRLVIGLAPQLAKLPAPITKYDEPFLPFGRAVIEVTAQYACGYSFDLARYLALGAAGAIALERTIALVPRELPVILHAPFASPHYVTAAFESPFAVDAVTLISGHIELVSPYAQNPHHGAFVQSSSAMTFDKADNVGFYDETGFELNNQRALWVTDPIIYATGQADFEAVMAKAAEIYRNDSIGA